MTLHISISVPSGETKSAVVSIVEDSGEPRSEPSTIVDPGQTKSFYVYPNHNLFVSEIPFDDGNGSPSTPNMINASKFENIGLSVH